MSGKKLINTVDRCVDENLEGLVAVNPGLRLIKDTRVVVRADIVDVKRQGKVTLLCGGGSGHEPAHAGISSISVTNCCNDPRFLDRHVWANSQCKPRSDCCIFWTHYDRDQT